MNNHLRETLISSELVYEGEFLKVRRDRVRLPDKSESVREYFRHPGAVVILPVLSDGKILLERQFRYPNDQIFIELPAGKLEVGEDPLTSAQRELKEETGYSAQSWRHLCRIHNAIAYSDEHLDIFLAENLTPGSPKLDSGEFLEVFSLSLNDLLLWIKSGKVTDVKTIIGAFWLEKCRAGDW